MQRPLIGRRGLALSELLVVIAFAGVMMAATTKLIVLMFQTERDARQRHHAMLTEERLLEQFQRDVQAATRQLPDTAQTSAPLVRLKMAKRPGAESEALVTEIVEYRLHGSDVDRTLRRASEVVARETFRLAENARVEVRAADRQPTRLTLVIRNMPHANAKHAGKEIQVHAILGRDARFGAAESERQP